MEIKLVISAEPLDKVQCIQGRKLINLDCEIITINGGDAYQYTQHSIEAGEDADLYINRVEYEWAKSELEASDIEIKYHERGSKRARLSLSTWYEYQEALRDYVTCDDDGNCSTLTEKPTKP